MLIIAAVMLLTGCSVGGDDGGKTVEGTGYEVTVPDGWDDESSRGEDIEIEGFSPELILTGEREDSFTTNVNVVVSKSAGLSLDDQVEGERRVLEGGRLGDTELPAASELTPVERISVDGVDARAYEFELESDGTRSRARQVVALNGGNVYAITFTTLPDRFEDDVGVFDDVLDSWTWR